MTPDEVAERFPVRRRAGDGWEVRCLVHDDHNPSVSVNIGRDGGVLVCCHAGCPTHAVIGAVGLSMVDLAPPDQQQRTNGERRIVATYDYVDETGELLFQVVRYDPKDFRQRRPDGHGGWVWKLGDTRRVLFNMPAVITAVKNGNTVFVVEGEKDALALASAGYVATCCPAGAGKWPKVPDAPSVLSGADVVIVPDRDEPGYAHARDVARSLVGHAAKITVADVPIGKDIAEMLGAGRTIDDLTSVASTDPTIITGKTVPLADWLIESEQASAAGDETTSSLPLPVDWAELFARDRSAEDWLVPKLWPRGRMISLSAPVKARKSLLMLYLAACLAVGRDPWTGAKRDAVRVVYMDFEMTEDDIVERLEDMGFGADDLANLRYFLRPEMPHMDTPEGGKILLQIIEEHDAVALVIDTFSRVVKTTDWGGNEVREFYRWSAMHVKAHGTAIARLDHVGHTEQNRAAGSVAKGADVDVGWVIHPGDGATMSLEHHGMSRVRWVPPKIELWISDDPLAFRLVGRVYEPGTSELAMVLDDLDVALDATIRETQATLKEAGKGRRAALVGDALQYRRDHPKTPGIKPGIKPRGDLGNHARSHDPQNMHLPGTESSWESRGIMPADNRESGGVTDREPPDSESRPESDDRAQTTTQIDAGCWSCGRALTADGRCMDPTCRSNEEF